MLPEQPQYNVQKKEFFMDWIEIHLKISLRNVLQKEDKNLDKLSLKYPYYLKLIHTNDSNSVTFWSKRNILVETTL